MPFVVVAMWILMSFLLMYARSANAEYIEVDVPRVLAGDTFEGEDMDQTPRRVRLLGVDAAPLSSRWIVGELGQKAALFAKDALLGQTVVLEYDVSSRDRYGRDLAYVWLSSSDARAAGELGGVRRMFNARLVLSGHALSMPVSPNLRYRPFFNEYEKEARRQSLGRWSLSDTGVNLDDLEFDDESDDLEPDDLDPGCED